MVWCVEIEELTELFKEDKRLHVGLDKKPVITGSLSHRNVLSDMINSIAFHNKLFQ